MIDFRTLTLSWIGFAVWALASSDGFAKSHCDLLQSYLNKDEMRAKQLIKEIRGIEEVFHLKIGQPIPEKTESKIPSIDLENPNVDVILSRKKKELKFVIGNLERNRLHMQRTCGGPVFSKLKGSKDEVQGDEISQYVKNDIKECADIAQALAPSLRYMTRLKRQVAIAEENLKFLKAKKEEVDRSKTATGATAKVLKYANIPPFVIAVAAPFIPQSANQLQKIFSSKEVGTIKKLGLPLTGMLVLFVVWNTSSKRKSAALHLDYLQTNDLLSDSKLELAMVEERVLSALGHEYLFCINQTGREED